jgi:hypothetical protein
MAFSKYENSLTSPPLPGGEGQENANMNSGGFMFAFFSPPPPWREVPGEREMAMYGFLEKAIVPPQVTRNASKENVTLG